MSDTVKSSATIAPVRVISFVDFWNYELTMKELDPNFLTNWFQLPSVIQKAVSQLFQQQVVSLERFFVFGSYDSTPSDTRLVNWANNVLSKIPSVAPLFFQRQKRLSGPKCTGKDHHEIKECPICHASMLGTQEKGIDTRIVTEMLDAAFCNRCDAIVLISADKDFVPAVEKLLNRNIKVIHAYFPNHGNELSAKSWASFDLFKMRDQFKR